MSTLDTECRREYYRIDDQIALQIRLYDSNDEEDSLIFNALSELHQLELDAQPLLRSVSENNRSLEQYFKVINKRIDLLGQMFVHNLLNELGPPRTVSLSECSLAFTGEEQYPVGSHLSLKIILLPYGHALQVAAQVTELRATEQGMQTVCVFENLSDAQRQILARHILHQQALQRRLALASTEQEAQP